MQDQVVQAHLRVTLQAKQGLGVHVAHVPEDGQAGAPATAAQQGLEAEGAAPALGAPTAVGCQGKEEALRSPKAPNPALGGLTFPAP